jgi:hypothetical protein
MYTIMIDMSVVTRMYANIEHIAYSDEKGLKY